MFAYAKNAFSAALLGAVAVLAGCAQATGSDDAQGGSAAETTGLSKDEALARLKGPFHGEWTMLGIDAAGNAKKLFHWTDTVTASDPIFAADKVFINATDMVLMDGATEPSPREWKEGYYLAADGSIGDRFIDQTDPRTHVETVSVEKEVAPNTFTIVETATPGDLAQLGFTNAVSGSHVTVKVVTTDGTTDSERISRVTTAQWKDATGADRFTQMITLQGVHQHAHSGS